jgi:hypothetical protein
VFKIFSTKSAKEIPAAAAALGTNEVAVIPGSVLISKK